MERDNLFNLYVEAYFGVREMDEYDLKEYVLKDIENYIKDFVYTNDIDINYAKENAERIKDEVNIKTKLQSSLILLNKMNAPEELILLVRKKIKNIDE